MSVNKEVSHRWGLAYFLGSCIVCRVSGGHLNPLVTVSLNLHHNPKQGWITVIIMVIAQYLGALLGAILAFLIYWDGINWWVYRSISKLCNSYFSINHLRFEHQVGEYRPVPQTAEIFSTYPPHFVTVFGAFLDQFLASAILVVCMSAVMDKKNKVGIN